jgi:hypothetical protein
MKRWIALAAVVLVGAPALALASLGLRYRPKAEREDPAAVIREIAALTGTRDSLRALVYEAVTSSDLLDRRPAGDIAIGLPTPFVDLIVQRVVAGWFHDVDLRLPRMRVRKDGEIKARLGILGRRTVGSYDLEVILDDVHGHLQPEAPTLRFGGDTIHVSVPVHVAAGTGIARVNAKWKSEGFTAPVCGDMSVSRDVTGRVRARDYVARGQIVMKAVNGTVSADPEFPDLAVRIFIDPARESVAALDSVLATRGGLCGYAVGKSNASERIQALVGRGFRVKIPQRFFRPIRLPVAVETEVPVADQSVSLEVTPSALTVTNSTVWIAATVVPVQRRALATPKK